MEDPSPALFYNDQQPDKIFYQGLAPLKPGRNDEANTRFNNPIKYGKYNMDKKVKIDFLAVSLPNLSIFDNDLNTQNNIHCHYLLGLGYLGLKKYEKAESHFQQALQPDPAHLAV